MFNALRDCIALVYAQWSSGFKNYELLGHMEYWAMVKARPLDRDRPGAIADWLQATYDARELT